MTDNAYNIVLLPDKQTSNILTDFAQVAFGKIHNGYCLEADKVFPHITLCQLNTPDTKIVERLKYKVGQVLLPKDLVIAFSGFYSDYGAKFTSIGFNVAFDEQLRDLQGSIHYLLETENLKPLTGTLSEYWPHVTLAQVSNKQQLPPIIIPNAQAFGKMHDWTLAMGESDPRGQFLMQL